MPEGERNFSAALKFSHQPFGGLGGNSPRKGDGRGQ